MREVFGIVSPAVGSELLMALAEEAGRGEYPKCARPWWLVPIHDEPGEWVPLDDVRGAYPEHNMLEVAYKAPSWRILVIRGDDGKIMDVLVHINYPIPA